MHTGSAQITQWLTWAGSELSSLVDAKLLKVILSRQVREFAAVLPATRSLAMSKPLLACG
jgi:hypothetical protein